MPLSPEPPADVKRQLRQEVNFGCPVPDCGEPFLSWHHFDPQYHIRPHHNPAGMIALCWKHHKMADREAFSDDDLRRFKAQPNPPEFIHGKFEWYCRAPIIRLGGCYANGWCEILINQCQVLRIGPGESGLMSMDFVLKAEDGSVLSSMHSNVLTGNPASLYDLSVTASGHMIKIWLEERHLGLHCKFSRQTIAQVEEMITADTPGVPSELQDFVLPPEPVANPDAFYRELASITDQMEVAAIGFRRRDAGGTFVRWHVARHLESDGRIPMIDFISCKFRSGGTSIEMRNGRMEQFYFCSANRFSFDNQDCSMG